MSGIIGVISDTKFLGLGFPKNKSLVAVFGRTVGRLAVATKIAPWGKAMALSHSS